MSTEEPKGSVADSIRKLKAAAIELNTASDALTDIVADFEAILKQQNLGIPAWVTISMETDEMDVWRTEVEVGYARTGPRWGVSIRSTDSHMGDQHESTTWLFNDAPRRLRLVAVDHFPKLVDELIKEAQVAAEGIRRKSTHAAALVASMKGAATSTTPHLDALKAAKGAK